MATFIVRFVNVILAALLAGTSFGICVGANPINLSPTTYIEQQQNTVHSLSTLMTLLVIGATVVTLASAFLQRTNKATFTTLLIAAGFFIACILITRFGNVPLDAIVLSWKPKEPPPTWHILRDQWWSFHLMRTGVELIALCLVSWTAIRKG